MSIDSLTRTPTLTLLTLGVPGGRWKDLAHSLLPCQDLAEWHRQTEAADEFDAMRKDVAIVSPAQVRALRSARAAGGAAWIGADEAFCWSAASLAARMPETRFLVWVEHPAQAAAHRLLCGEEDISGWLSGYEAASRGLLRLIDSQRSRCLVVHVDEVRPNLEGFRDRLLHWFPEVDRLLPPVAMQNAQHSVDPVAMVIAERIVGRNPSAMRLFQRLYASCLPLAQVTEPVVPLPPDDNPHLLRRWRELQSRALRGDALEGELQQAERDRAALTSKLQTLRQDETLLLAQLHQAQEELEATFQQLAQRQLDARQSEERHVEQAKRLASDLEQSRQRLLQTEHELDERGKQLTSSRQENELLLVQLHQVQEEVDHYYRGLCDLESAARQREEADARRRSVEIVGERDTPPHRELSLRIPHVLAGDVHFDSLGVRLVEHHGRTGLALFSQPEGRPLLGWLPDGEEAGSEYVLLIPSDGASSRRLQFMGTADWQVVTSLVQRIVQALTARAEVPVRWRNAALALQLQLEALPSRFRYDHAAADPDPESRSQVRVRFSSCCFGDEALGKVELNWDPAQGRVDLIAGEDAQPQILSQWPMEDDGRWARRWSVPLDGQRPQLRARWNELSRRDRELLLAVLDALPAAAASLATPESARLREEAALPLRKARGVLAGTRLLRVLRAARGRTLPLV